MKDGHGRALLLRRHTALCCGAIDIAELMEKTGKLKSQEYKKPQKRCVQVFASECFVFVFFLGFTVCLHQSAVFCVHLFFVVVGCGLSVDRSWEEGSNS